MNEFETSNRKTLSYCTTCPKLCRFACPVAHEEARETVTPWGLMNLLTRAVRGPGLNAELADVLGHCTGCLACQTACLHGIHVPKTLFEAREWARNEGLGLGWEVGVTGAAEVRSRLDGAALGFSKESRVGFFPACEGRVGDLGAVRRMARIFERAHFDVQLVESPWACCGAPLLANGKRGLYADHAAQLAERFASFDVVATDCDELVATSRTPAWRQEAAGGGERVIHWTELMEEGLVLSDLKSALAGDARVFVYQDSCALARGAGVTDAPRALLRWILGREAEEMPDKKEWSRCCGAGAGMPQVAPETAANLARKLVAGRGEVFVRTSRSCGGHVASHYEGDAKLMLLDELLADALGVEDDA